MTNKHSRFCLCDGLFSNAADKKQLSFCLVIALLFVFLLTPASIFAWPTTNEWIPVYKNGIYLQDPNGDTNGSRNVVSDSSNPAAYIFNDGTYLYFRLRLDQDPSGTGGQGLLKSFGWGVLFDTNLNPGDYEWLMMLDGISQTEIIGLWQNTSQGTLGDPGDAPEILQASIPVSGNFQVTMANTSFNGDQDYFLDWRFPYATFKQTMGLTDYSPIRLFFGASSNASRLTQSGGDLVGASDLYAGLSDVITVIGTTPATGIVKFVADLAGNGDVMQILAGDTLYIRVIDGDMNYNITTLQTVTVTLRATSGDTSSVTLTETGVNTGIFTGAIPTQSGAAISGDGILQVTPGTTVTVEYIDFIDAAYNLNQIRADSVWVITLTPLISLVKNADTSSAQPTTEVVYTIYFKNSGMGAASNLVIVDTIPPNTTYVTGNLRIGAAASTYATATALTDAADADAGQFSASSAIFTITTVSADDSVANSGTDEGKVYFKVRIN
ncbi:MAG: DUF11 domain-containing protein [Deltaproteobacteria bacterium]|nr:DUF11 domain-containing protein [Deltaproteobacteria bacterium]